MKNGTSLIKVDIVMRLQELRTELSYREKEYDIAAGYDPALETLLALETRMKRLGKKIALFSSAINNRSDSRGNIYKG